MVRTVLAASMLAALVACATTPTGRSQMLLVSDGEIERMGATAFEKMRTGGKPSRDAAMNRRADCVTRAIVGQLEPVWRQRPWEVQVFDDASLNAFALPGGKVGVNTGLMGFVGNDDELAVVIGHEIAHVVFRHGAERVSQQFAAGAALELVNAYVGSKGSPAGSQQVLALLGIGAQVGVMLPFSRKHEREADVYGQRLMAQAGYNPAAAATLWQRMAAQQSGPRPPLLLSTHPDPSARAQDLQQRSGEHDASYRAARTAGRPAACR